VVAATYTPLSHSLPPGASSAGHRRRDTIRVLLFLLATFALRQVDAGVPDLGLC